MEFIIIFTVAALMAFMSLVYVVGSSTGFWLISRSGLLRILVVFVSISLLVLSATALSLKYLIIPGSFLDTFLNLLTSARSVILLSGLAFGVLLGVRAEDKYRLSVATTDPEKAALKKRLAYENAGLFAVIVFGVAGAALSDPLGRIMSRIEAIPTPYGEIRLKSNVVPVASGQQGGTSTNFRDPSEYLNDAATVGSAMQSDRDIARLIAAEIGKTGSAVPTVDDIVPSDELIAQFNANAMPFFNCATALFHPTRMITGLESGPVVAELRALVRNDLDRPDLDRVAENQLVERLTLHVLRAYQAVADAARLSGGLRVWGSYCSDFLAIMDAENVKEILANCEVVVQRVECGVPQSFDALIGHVNKVVGRIDDIKKPYLVIVLQQLLAFDDNLLAATVEGDRWLLKTQDRYLAYAAKRLEAATPDEANKAALGARFLRIQMIAMRDNLIRIIREYTSTARDDQKQALYNEYAGFVKKQLNELEAAIGPFDWTEFYDGDCLSEPLTDENEALNQALRDRRTVNLGNLLYVFAQLDDFDKNYARDVFDKANTLHSYLISCVRNKQITKGRVAVLETVGTSYLRLVAMFAERSPYAFGHPSTLLNNAEDAYSLCREFEREAAGGSSGVTAERPMIYRLNQWTQGALLGRCEWGLEKVRELRRQLL